ncbi:MAG: hypothetical protein M0R47_08125 [Methylobacter sp.]|uniref:hypothetical protein n=1 Tax=Methylobacter sp. TaxID=2051955 RepID=UPI0025E58E0E|nr:hypothetical protein [Methylobacter sp.]MCK9620486.1 hypothetical protein [Methylobacter sp.]
MQRVVISGEPYLLSMVFSRFILIGKLYKIVIKVCHPYRGFNQQVLDKRDSMRLTSKIHHPEAGKIVALPIDSEYTLPTGILASMAC